MRFNEGDKHKPTISYDSETNELEISGNSFPENADSIYFPVLNWLNELDIENINKLILRISLKYYNTASSKKLFEIVKKVNYFWKKGLKTAIHWEYFSDDEDMFESGRYYSELVEVPFHFIEIPD